MKLLIISHTEHYRNEQGTIVGWGPTLTEINNLATIFDEIYHIATFLDIKAPASSLPYTSENIHFIPIKHTGGKKMIHKLDIVWNAPSIIAKVLKTLNMVDLFQLRAPTGIGVYLIPFLTLFSNKKGWFKYAGNWNQNKPPFGYAIQRWFLKRQKRIVTINGAWKNQLEQCLTFENPCLTFNDRKEGKQIIKTKKFEPPYTYCFAGRLEDPKGVRKIIEAFNMFEDTNSIKEVHLIGDGKNKGEYEKMAKSSAVNFKFHGFLKGIDVLQLFKESHFFLLPSTASEGFPKVIAEAINFGCIPIVSDVSSIGQYIKNNENGLIVNPVNKTELYLKLKESFSLSKKTIGKFHKTNFDLAEKFTYQNYLNRISQEVIK